MPSEMKTVAYVTGFGPFAHIKVNPSSTVAEKVANMLEAEPNVTVHFTELECSIKFVTEYFAKLEPTIEETLKSDPAVKILLFHVGVHSREKDGLIRVEVQGFNELFASIPDVNGVPLNHDPIVPADGPIETTLESAFGRQGSPALATLEGIVLELNAAIAKRHAEAGFQLPHWEISRDAGRYLCNCTLYRALRVQERYPGRVYGVFIHVSDPTQGKEAVKASEEEETRVEAYNPSVMEQGEEVKMLVRKFLVMME